MACDPIEVLGCETADTVEDLLPFLNSNFAVLKNCIEVLQATSGQGIEDIPDMLMSAGDLVNDIDFNPGSVFNVARDQLGINIAGKTKRLDAAWVAGTGVGGNLSPGGKTINTLYRIYALIHDPGEVGYDPDDSLDYGFLADGDDIDTYVPAGYTYRPINYARTNGANAIIGFTNRGSWLKFHTRSENHIGATLGTVYGLVDHTSVLPEEMTLAVAYGTHHPSNSGYRITASDDGGTDTSAGIGTSNATNSDILDYAWNQRGEAIIYWLPYQTERQFKAGGTGCSLCLSGVILRR